MIPSVPAPSSAPTKSSHLSNSSSDQSPKNLRPLAFANIKSPSLEKLKLPLPPNQPPKKDAAATNTSGGNGHGNNVNPAFASPSTGLSSSSSSSSITKKSSSTTGGNINPSQKAEFELMPEYFNCSIPIARFPGEFFEVFFFFSLLFLLCLL
jgi:hypothetical protein